MSKIKSAISRKKLIKRIARKAGISKRKAEKAYKAFLDEGAFYSRTKFKVIGLNDEVPLESIKELTVVKEIPVAVGKDVKAKNKAKAKKKSTANKSKVNKSKGAKKKDGKLKIKNKNSIIVEPQKPKKIRESVSVEKTPEKVLPKVIATEPKEIKTINVIQPALDDLTKIEGIGPAISKLLQAEGINTFNALATTSVSRIRGILDAAGSRFRVHDPGTWPQQSALAADDNWDELQQLQDRLKGGR